ncbi:MAG TPA: SDR family oxidoreductase [Actinomycetota bacterium]|jgi:NAD(P)-dependent dehydrogenase (short-subunit alcohol dehydrogenase family)|nr:SDR family oxidoreductase [Actinomycetota bacterium]
MAGSLEGKVALVTGAGSGIGRAAALAFAREGAKVVVADVAADGGKETVRLIEQAGGAALFVEGDVSASASAEAIVRTAVDHYGRLDCAYNNAGIEGAQAPIAEATEDNWDRVLSINLKGVWLCMKHELAHMAAHGGGAIVNTASVAGLVGFPGISAYCASKGGVVMLTKTAALEYATQGIRVNAVCPGVIRTPMIDRFLGGSAEAEAEFVALEPVERMGTPEEVAEAVVWLCSDAASFVTGHAMPVDGGLVAR